MVEPSSIATGAASWLWSSYGKNLLNSIGKAIGVKWSRIDWEECQRVYANKLAKEHSTIKLLGNPKEIQIDKIYTDVYILSEISAFRRLEIEELYKYQSKLGSFYNTNVRKSLLDVVRTNSNVFILGKPGSGKSTFLKNVIKLCCDGKINKTSIFVSLRKWSDSGLSLDEFVSLEFDICGFPQPSDFIRQLLKDGGAILLFDGLDEVPNFDQKRRKVIDQISDFCRRYDSNQVILTCRTASTDYSFSKFKYVEIADFTSDQQSDFIGKWFAEKPEVLSRIINEFFLAKNSDLVDLARTPLLLALLCLAYDSTLSFPTRRVELYEEAINALLRKWDSSREIYRDDVYKGLSHIRKEQMLRRVAFETYQDAELIIKKHRILKILTKYFSEIPPNEIAKDVDPDLILASIEAQHGLLIERACNIYSFSHLTIHEYFCAKRLAESAGNDWLINILRNNACDDQWREIILMTSSMVDDGTFIVECFSEQLAAALSEFDYIHIFVSKILSSNRRSSNVRGIRDEGRVISDTCVSICRNIKHLGLRKEYLAIPRRISLVINRHMDFEYYNFSVFQLAEIVKYFRLLALLTDCLVCASIRCREEYIANLFKPFEQN
jgi:predicted NACHT family NTPase